MDKSFVPIKLEYLEVITKMANQREKLCKQLEGLSSMQFKTGEPNENKRHECIEITFKDEAGNETKIMAEDFECVVENVVFTTTTMLHNELSRIDYLLGNANAALLQPVKQWRGDYHG